MLNRNVHDASLGLAGRALRAAAGLALLAALSACSTVDALTPDFSATTSSTGVAATHPRFSDSDPHEWEGGAPWNYAVHGTDVSKYQALGRLARGQGQRRLLRLHQGDRRRRPRRRPLRRALARRAGGRRAARRLSFLLFLPPGRRAGALVHRQRAARNAARCRRCSTWNGTRSRRPASCGPTAATVRSEMTHLPGDRSRSITARSRSSTRRSTSSTTTTCLGFRGYPYWLRSVADHPADRYGDHPFTFWQYTGTGIVPGIQRQRRHQCLQRQRGRMEEVARRQTLH